MKRVLSIITIISLLMVSLAVCSFADNETGSLSEIVEQSKIETQEQVEQVEAVEQVDNSLEEIVTTIPNEVEEIGEVGTTGDSEKVSIQESNEKYIKDMQEMSDLTKPDVEGAQHVTNAAVKVAAFIVQVISYVIIAFLAVRVLIDMLYIAIPFVRTFLANGYGGNPQAEGNMQNANMGMGMNGGMGSGMYGRGGYGHGRYGQGMMTGAGGMGMTGMNGMGANNGMAMGNQRNSMFGQVQWVSNAALNAVASESAIGPDGKAPSAFKIYIKDMLVVLIITPVLIVLAATGVLTQLGFVIGEALIKAIVKFGAML